MIKFSEKVQQIEKSLAKSIDEEIENNSFTSTCAKEPTSFTKDSLYDILKLLGRDDLLLMEDICNDWEFDWIEWYRKHGSAFINVPSIVNLDIC